MTLFLNLVFALDEVVVKLIDELLALIQRNYMPLPTTVSLVLDYLPAFFGGDHCHLEPLAFDFGFVHFAGFLLRGQDGFRRFFQIL